MCPPPQKKKENSVPDNMEDQISIEKFFLSAQLGILKIKKKQKSKELSAGVNTMSGVFVVLSGLRTQCYLCEDAGSIPGIAQWG